MSQRISVQLAFSVPVLPDDLMSAGAVNVVISYHGVSSNSVIVTIAPEGPMAFNHPQIAPITQIFATAGRVRSNLIR